ncbi:hypothetical protein WJX72_009825 [[Myrmecia] bisecta]|uniref:Uncharacterized protein n=1 Tax=[Myrmecia] bisecta TaxID=41462 RepID=A0AAW1P8Z4_9CHLO
MERRPRNRFSLKSPGGGYRRHREQQTTIRMEDIGKDACLPPHLGKPVVGLKTGEELDPDVRKPIYPSGFPLRYKPDHYAFTETEGVAVPPFASAVRRQRLDPNIEITPSVMIYEPQVKRFPDEHLQMPLTPEQYKAVGHVAEKEASEEFRRVEKSMREPTKVAPRVGKIHKEEWEQARELIAEAESSTEYVDAKLAEAIRLTKQSDENFKLAQKAVELAQEKLDSVCKLPNATRAQLAKAKEELTDARGGLQV